MEEKLFTKFAVCFDLLENYFRLRIKMDKKRKYLVHITLYFDQKTEFFSGSQKIDTYIGEKNWGFVDSGLDVSFDEDDNPLGF